MLYSTIAKGLKAGPTPVLPVGFDPEETAPTSTTSTATTSKKSKSATSPIDTTKLKTRLCRHFSENNHCPFGDKCAFAHGQNQVAAAPANEDTLSAPETEDAAPTTTIKAATPAPSTASDSDDQSSSAPSSSVNIPAPRSRTANANAAAAALPTGADATIAVISPRRPVEWMSALPRSASRASLLSNTAAPPKYGFATSRTASRMSIGGLSDTTDTTFVAPPPASLRRRPTGGVVSRVPSSTAASSSQNQLPPPPPYESSVAFSDDHSAHSGDGFGRSAPHGGCPSNCTCNDCTSYDGANWHFQREEVLTPVSQVQTSSPNKSRIPSPMAAGGSGRFSFNPYDPVTPFVMSY